MLPKYTARLTVLVGPNIIFTKGLLLCVGCVQMFRWSRQNMPRWRALTWLTIVSLLLVQVGVPLPIHAQSEPAQLIAPSSCGCCGESSCHCGCCLPGAASAAEEASTAPKSALRWMAVRRCGCLGGNDSLLTLAPPLPPPTPLTWSFDWSDSGWVCLVNSMLIVITGTPPVPPPRS